MKKFITKKGWLTRYALACGYIETNVGHMNNDEYLSLALENNTFHVRGRLNSGIIWKVFDPNEYKSARKHFLSVLKSNGMKRKIQRN